MDHQSSAKEVTNKIHIDTSVKIGNYDMKFKATGYKSEQESLFSVIIYDKLYELSGKATAGNAFEWKFADENLLPEDLATVIGKEIEKFADESELAA